MAIDSRSRVVLVPKASLRAEATGRVSVATRSPLAMSCSLVQVDARSAPYPKSLSLANLFRNGVLIIDYSEMRRDKVFSHKWLGKFSKFRDV